MGKRSRTKRESTSTTADTAARNAERDAGRAVTDPDRKIQFLTATALALAVLVAFGRVAGHSFIAFDDYEYIVQNPHVLGGLTGTNIAWAWRSIYASNWHPLTWMSHMLDVQLFGLAAGKHLLVNVALHAATTVLLYFFFARATKRQWPSAVVAAVFALHPLHVESVAWAAERKDTLSAFFFALALVFYRRWVHDRSRQRYILALMAFALGLTAKPMLVTFPFVLLLLDWWPLRRELRWNLVIEKLPFFALTIFSSLMTMRAQVEAIGRWPLGVRLSNATVSYAAYLGQSLLPLNLAIMYPFRTHVPAGSLVGSIVLLVAISGISIAAARRAPYVLVGWLWYLGTLVPVIGIVQVGVQAMADRYMYIPMIGLAFAVVWLIADLVSNAKALAVTALVLLATYGVLTFVQVGYWKDSFTLFRHAIAAVPNNAPAHVLMAVALQKSDRRAAVNECREALKIDPYSDRAAVILAVSLAGLGDTTEALRVARAATVNPRNAEAWKTLGLLQLQMGDRPSAIDSLRKSLALKDDDEVVAGMAHASGRTEEAIEKYREVLQYKPEEVNLRNNLAALLAASGRDQEAVVEYRTTIEQDPNFYDGHMNLGALLSRMGNDAQAAKEFAEAARIRPQSSEPHVYLALIHSNAGRFREAVSEVDAAIASDRDAANRQFTNAIRIPPKDTNIEEYRAFLQSKAEGR